MKDYIFLDTWFCQILIPKESGITAAKRRHDALARKRYHKPFKWFKFNRARKATAK
jgi:hypothetical protein